MKTVPSTKHNWHSRKPSDRQLNMPIAIFRPTIDAQGNLSVSVSALNVPGAFTGKVNNSANIGMSTEQMVDLWNEEHPADLIVLEASPEPQQ
jgi:hypothetical protein